MSAHTRGFVESNHSAPYGRVHTKDLRIDYVIIITA